MEANKGDYSKCFVRPCKERKTEKDEKRPKYRSGVDNLSARVEKKLVKQYNWFRMKRKSENERDEKDSEVRKKVKDEKEKSVRDEKSKEEEIPKSILFVQDTMDNMLSNEIRRLYTNSTALVTLCF